MSIKRKIYLTLVTVSAAIGLTAYAIIVPTWREIMTVITAIRQERIDLEEKYQRGQRMKKIAVEYRKIKELRNRLDTMYIPSGDELPFITTLERLEREYGVEATPATELLGGVLGPTDPLPLTLTVRGNYGRVIRYLIALERLSYFYNISTLTITAANPDRGEVNLRLAGQVFRKPYTPPAAAGTPAAEPAAPNPAMPAPVDGVPSSALPPSL